MKTKKIITTIIIIGGLIMPITAIAQEAKQVSAYDLQLSFQNNEDTFRYKDVIISGVVTRVGPDVYGLPSIELSDKAGGKMYVLCVLPTLDYLKLRHVSKGDKVKISGEARGLHEDFVVVKHSKVVEQIKSK